MAKTKLLSENVMIACAMGADDQVHQVWAWNKDAEAGVETTPTLEQIAALQRLGIAYQQLALTLLAHHRMAADRISLESRLRAEITEAG